MLIVLTVEMIVQNVQMQPRVKIAILVSTLLDLLVLYVLLDSKAVLVLLLGSLLVNIPARVVFLYLFAKFVSILIIEKKIVNVQILTSITPLTY